MSKRSTDVPVRWLDTDQASKYLRISPRTLADMRARADGPRCRRVSHKRVLYDIADLDAWVLRRDAR